MPRVCWVCIGAYFSYTYTTIQLSTMIASRGGIGVGLWCCLVVRVSEPTWAGKLSSVCSHWAQHLRICDDDEFLSGIFKWTVIVALYLFCKKDNLSLSPPTGLWVWRWWQHDVVDVFTTELCQTLSVCVRHVHVTKISIWRVHTKFKWRQFEYHSAIH